MIRTWGTSGSATVDPSSITGTTTVTVTGGEQTSVGCANNLSLRAKLDGSCICDTETFSVCAHPEDFEATLCDAVLFWKYYGLEVFYTWESDSGAVTDLDQCHAFESFSNVHGDTPPFYDVGAPEEDDFYMSTGTQPDRQGWLKTSVKNYTDGDAGWDQRIHFICYRCSGYDTLTSNTTTFTVYDKPDGSDDWWIDTEVSMSCPGPPGGCIVEENIP